MSTFTPRDPDFAAKVRQSFGRQGLMTQGFGAEIVSLELGRVRLRLPLSVRVTQQLGLFHGGVIGALCDTAAGYAAMTLVGPEDEIVTAEYKINFIAPGRGEVLEATGEVVRPGRTLLVCRAEAHVQGGHTGTLCAIAQLTMMPIRMPA